MSAAHRIYVAASFGERDLARAVAASLRAQGFATTSRWHERTLSDAQADVIDADPVARQAAADRDYEDVRAADGLLLLWSPACRGALCEATFACDLGKRVVAVGDPMKATLMLCRKGVEWYPTIADAAAALAHPAARRA